MGCSGAEGFKAGESALEVPGAAAPWQCFSYVYRKQKAGMCKVRRVLAVANTAAVGREAAKKTRGLVRAA